MEQDEAYKAWWHNEGSGILPLPNEDMEEFAHRMTQIAWSNGAFKEREACAKECWKQMGLLPTQAWTVNPYEQCIDAIRARGQA
jgi:hypothetical protein